jgi:hypothetical protein
MKNNTRMEKKGLIRKGRKSTQKCRRVRLRDIRWRRRRITYKMSQSKEKEQRGNEESLDK